MAGILSAILVFIIWFVPTAIAVLPFILVGNQGGITEFISILSAPFLFIIAFPLLAGALSRIGQRAQRAGHLAGRPDNSDDLNSKIFGLCWSQVSCFNPLYAIVIATPALRGLVFRLFGYNGSNKISIHPYARIRHLPMLNIEARAYIGPRAAIGTNLCLSDGTTLIEKVKIASNAIIDRLSMLAPGVRIGERAEVGAGCALGIRVMVKESASIKPNCAIGHGAIIGAHAEIGRMSFVGIRAEIGDKIRLPAGSNIPAGTVIKSQEDVEVLYSSETERLKTQRRLVAEILMKHTNS